MKKETFIEAIQAIKAQENYDRKFSEHLGKAFPDAFEEDLSYDNHFLLNALVQILQDEMENEIDRDSWIEYFCFELNFGIDYKPGCATYADGKNIDLSTPGKLYEFLKSEKELKHKIQ